MIRSLIFVAVIGVSILIPLGTSTPALAQTCQQKCDAQYPNAGRGDSYQRRMLSQCLRACNKGGGDKKK